MQQPTNADLKKEIEKRGILICFLIAFIIGMFLILIFKWTWFALGIIVGAILIGGHKLMKTDDRLEL